MLFALFCGTYSEYLERLNESDAYMDTPTSKWMNLVFVERSCVRCLSVEIFRASIEMYHEVLIFSPVL